MNRKTHILVECPDLIPSVRAGVLEPLLTRSGSDYEIQFVATVNFRKQHLVWADMLVTVRGSEAATLHIVREARRLGRFVVYYLDDDLLNLPKDSASYAYFSKHHLEKNMREILSLCDVLWGVNTRIKEKYLPLCQTYRWVQNRVPMEAVSTLRTDTSEYPVKILYAGSTDHEKMVREILSPAVRQICAARGDKVHFTFVGPDPGIKDCLQVSYHRFFADYQAYHAFVEQQNFSIGLAVVRTDDFYQCKYYNKFVEYSGIGVAGVYTDCDLYRQVVVNGENGLLCENTTQGWITAIERLVDDPLLRQSCIVEAQKLLQREFQHSDICDGLVSQMPELTDFRAPQVSLWQVRLRPIRVEFYFEKIKWLLQEYGLFAIPVISFKAVKVMFKQIRKAVCNAFRVYQRN